MGNSFENFHNIFEIKFKILISNERENNSKNYDIFQVFDKKRSSHLNHFLFHQNRAMAS